MFSKLDWVRLPKVDLGNTGSTALEILHMYLEHVRGERVYFRKYRLWTKEEILQPGHNPIPDNMDLRLVKIETTPFAMSDDPNMPQGRNRGPELVAYICFTRGAWEETWNFGGVRIEIKRWCVNITESTHNAEEFPDILAVAKRLLAKAPSDVVTRLNLHNNPDVDRA